MHSTTIVGYTFQADAYCPEDTAAIVYEGHAPTSMSVESALNLMAHARGIDRMDERSFDSDEFPKVIFADSVEDDTERCGACHRPLIDS